ncbi:hypothetical protein [Marinobacter sp.]|uniref:hypothetical protein n=1 Tax=Marinobacter sp. TaxID=50741 RepID=UPI002B48731F|nr:hypothetical protein [Marinobacter sp.]HKK54820.1 hypothetical protein [Marinobacter sp.]
MINRQTTTAENDAAAFRVLQINCVSHQAPISARVIMPAGPVTQPPIVAIHGISRDCDAVVDAFLEDHMDLHRIVIVPHFDKKHWPVFQRITGKHRPDLGLLAILAALHQDGILGNETVDLFGYSGGAQLAHRFSMLFPEKVNELHLGAAGWYTLPDSNLPYPLGLGNSDSTRKSWHQLMANGLHQYLDRPITVYIGDQDVKQDRSLRNDTLVNQTQGRNRLERAKRYIDLVAQHQAGINLPVTARLEVLANCGHDFLDCCKKGGLIRRINWTGDRAANH